MKKLILGVAAVAFAASMSFAGDISVGARAGLNFGTLWGDDTNEDTPWGLGFNVGVDGKYGINDMVSVVPEIGVNLHRSADDDATWSTWAIDVPVLARINVMPQVFVDVGPSFNFLLSSKIEFEDQAYSDYGIATVDFGGDEIDGLNLFEFGVVAGAGYALKPNLDLNFRLAIGFTSIVDAKQNLNGIEIGWDNVKNMQFQAGATYWFL